ncbi:uncharacterized protein DS421_14g463400 [Arachis hypogaea]|nr:uncharacterized protein DS421_14g463400 [Arachis hypogaea]
MPGSKSHLGVPLERPGVACQCSKKPKQGLGVPLDVEGVARQPKNLTMACHLSTGCGTPVTGTKEAKYMGCATWCRRCGTPSTIPHLGMPLESQAWHTSVIQRVKEPLGRAT